MASRDRFRAAGYSADFPGKQEDERILYVVRPHWLMKLVSTAKVLLLGGVAAAIWYRTAWKLDAIDQELERYGYMVIGFFALLGLWWVDKYFRSLRTYLTDRRIIRFEAVFPITEKRRALFWSNVVKTRGVAPNVFFRAANIGTVEVSPLLVEKIGGIDLYYTYYFEDVANYMDKIIHFCKNHPERVHELRPFITKPKGQRYPQDIDGGDARIQ